MRLLTYAIAQNANTRSATNLKLPRYACSAYMPSTILCGIGINNTNVQTTTPTILLIRSTMVWLYGKNLSFTIMYTSSKMVMIKIIMNISMIIPLSIPHGRPLEPSLIDFVLATGFRLKRVYPPRLIRHPRCGRKVTPQQ